MPPIALLAAAITLVATATAVLSHTRGSNPELLRQQQAAQTITAQLQLMQARLAQCALQYPAGDNGTGIRPALPAAAAPVAVSALTCPGAPANWFWSSSVALPPAPAGVEYSYVNDALSARIVASGESTVLARAAAQLRTAASASGSTLTFVVQQ